MASIFEDAPKFHGMRGDKAKVAENNGRVLIRAIDRMAEEAVTIAMNPAQARELAAGIAASADRAESAEAKQE